MLIAFIVSFAASIAAFFAKIFFARQFAPKPPAEAALQQQRAMDQAIINKPTQSQAVADLERGDA